MGRLDLCFNVRDLARSLAFYEALGFRKVEGSAKEGWAVLARGVTRVGLFKGYFKGTLLNFRGGDVEDLVAAMETRGLRPFEVKLKGGGVGRASLRDPDGNVLFFDTTARERAARKRAKVK